MPARPVLAVVGSVNIGPNDERAPYAAALIVEAIEKFRPELVISGGARGIDTLAADVAKAYGLPVVEYVPAVHNWEQGYKPRNIKIARNCTHLLRIAAKESSTYGSGWTADRAEYYGVTVGRVTL